jgi:hypothetical protein
MAKIAPARLAEAEVVADDQVPHRRPRTRMLLDELFGSQAASLRLK